MGHGLSVVRDTTTGPNGPFLRVRVLHIALLLLKVPMSYDDDDLIRLKYQGMHRTRTLTTTNGIPIKPSSFLHSSLCSLVTLTVRLEKRSTSSAVPFHRVNAVREQMHNITYHTPVSLASSPSSLASSRFSNRLESYQSYQHGTTLSKIRFMNTRYSPHRLSVQAASHRRRTSV